MSYPPYAASLFASNDICRSLMAFGAVLYGRPLYENLGIGPGTSLLAGLSFLGVVSPLYFKMKHLSLLTATTDWYLVAIHIWRESEKEVKVCCQLGQRLALWRECQAKS
jgi:hypothetical protein